MIKTEQQYKQARLSYREGLAQLQRQQEGMRLRDYSAAEIEALTSCTTQMLAENQAAIDLYKRLKGKDPTALRELPLNRQLIGLRIWLGVSQGKLASLLGISRDEIARDERNDYRDLTLQRYLQILTALGLKIVPAYIQGDWGDAQEAQTLFCGICQADPDKILIG